MTLDAFAVCLVVKVSAAVCFRVLKIISQTKMTDFCSFHVHKPLSILGACFGWRRYVLLKCSQKECHRSLIRFSCVCCSEDISAVICRFVQTVSHLNIYAHCLFSYIGI